MTRQLTESVNPNSRDIDLKSIPEILTIINNEDMLVPMAVQKALPQIAQAVEAVKNSLETGGRLIYYGAGFQAVFHRFHCLRDLRQGFLYRQRYEHIFVVDDRQNFRNAFKVDIFAVGVYAFGELAGHLASLSLLVMNSLVINMALVIILPMTTL